MQFNVCDCREVREPQHAGGHREHQDTQDDPMLFYYAALRLEAAAEEQQDPI